MASVLTLEERGNTKRKKTLKVGVMTWHQYHNYGTALQLFALSETLHSLKMEPYIINYHARGAGANGTKNSLASRVWNKVERLQYHNIDSKEREEKFQDFYQKHLSFTAVCDTLPELERLNDWLDAFVCGSDQIWAPTIFDPHYYLDFVTDENKTIAYAPSIGLPEVKNSYVREKIEKYAGRIHYISTREESGSQRIAEIIGREVETVLDPTLLMSRAQWEKVSNKAVGIETPYLLVYMLGHNEAHWRAVYSIAKKLDLIVIAVPVFEEDYEREGCIQYAVGPEEFISLISGASFVCTDSYHGTLFSVIFNKSFCVFKRFKDQNENNQNSRIYYILNILHLESRLLKNRDQINTLVNERINYEEINELLEEKRERSFQYLKNALREISVYSAQAAKNNIKKDLTLCCGCGACMAVCPTKAIHMEMNEEGFMIAVVDDEKCTSCGKCRTVCPYISSLGGKSCTRAKLYSYKSNSQDVLLASSSGGAAFALGELALKEDYQIAGCTFDRATQTSKHIIVSDENGLLQLQGSKYMQSRFFQIAERLVGKENIMVFGTPCQIAAARKLCKATDNVVLIDLICHGVPSYYLYRSYQNYLQRKHGMNTGEMEISFRYKPKGWREIYINSADSKKAVCCHQNRDPYFLCFEYGVCYTKNCFECPWRDKSQADIRVGDYWGPRFEQDRTGVSMAAALTDKGETWIRKLQESGSGVVNQTDTTDYQNYQQTVNLAAPLFRSKVICMLRNGTLIEDVVKQFVKPMYFERRQTVFLSRMKHGLKKVIMRHE